MHEAAGGGDRRRERADRLDARPGGALLAREARIAEALVSLHAGELAGAGATLREVAKGLSAADVQARTEPTLRVASDLKEIDA